MTFQQLRYIVAIADHGSFSAAARSLRLAVPSVSDQVRRLEAEMGVPLFVRAGRSVELTDAGRDLLPHARHLLDAAEQAHRSVADVRELRRGVLTVGLFRNADYYLLADVACAFLGSHPGVQLRLLGQNSVEVATAVRRGELEAGIVVLPVDDEALNVRPLARDPVLYVSADPRRTREPVSVAALAEAPLVLYDARFGSTDPTRRQLTARAQQRGLVIGARVEVERVEAAVQLVARGLVDTILASAVYEHFATTYGLHAVSFTEPLFDTLAVVSRRGAKPSRAAARFLALAEEHLEALTRTSHLVQ